ncbi:MAG: hypothetical protein LUD47_05445 [Clostridia bacterium]|nr:hypothetical protein [Clostridia bacterium]
MEDYMTMYEKIVNGNPVLNKQKIYDQNGDFMKSCPFLKQPEDVMYSTDSIYLDNEKDNATEKEKDK